MNIKIALFLIVFGLIAAGIGMFYFNNLASALGN